MTGQRKIPKELQHLDRNFLDQQDTFTLTALAKLLSPNHQQSPTSTSVQTGKTA